MKIQHSVTIDGPELGKVSHVHIVIADHADPAKRTEWIDARVAVELPLVRNGVLLRRDALEKARDTLDELIRDLANLAHQAHG